jgi:MSHA biogenesis protein MshI
MTAGKGDAMAADGIMKYAGRMQQSMARIGTWTRHLKTSTVRDGMACIAPHDDGFAVVHVVRRRGDARPLVRACNFVPIQHAEDLTPLSKVLRRLSLDKSTFVGLLMPGEYKLFPSEAPDVPAADLADAVRWRIKDRLEFPVAEAVVDVFSVPENRASAQKMIYVAAARDETVRQCASVFHRLKLNLASISIAELALLQLISMSEDDGEGVGFLFLDRTRGLVLTSRNRQMFLARPVEYGVEQVVESVGGRADAGPQELSSSFVVDAIALEVQRTLDYYESHFGQAPAVALHIAPMPVPITALRETLGDKLGMRIKDFPIRTMFDFEGEFEDADIARCLLALGAALYTEGSP